MPYVDHVPSLGPSSNVFWYAVKLDNTCITHCSCKSISFLNDKDLAVGGIHASALKINK